MVKKALMLLGVLAIVGVAGLSLLLPDAVSASGHSATRSFTTNPVITGAELEIEISVSGLGGAGLVRETLPEGFSFARSDESPHRGWAGRPASSSLVARQPSATPSPPPTPLEPMSSPAKVVDF